MLIIEGPDGVGKTTLAMTLRKYLPRHFYSHMTKPGEGFDFYWDYLDRIGRNVIQDRFHWGEAIYPQAVGRDSQLDLGEFRLIEARLRLVGSFLVLITAELDLVEERWHSDQMFSCNQTVAAASEYIRVMERGIRTPPNSMVYQQVDCDEWIHCTHEKPYVNIDDIARIVEAYKLRQAEVARIAARRPSHL